MRYCFFLLLTTVVFAQQTQSVDFKTIQATIEINPIKRNVVGQCQYFFDVKNKIDTIRIDAVKARHAGSIPVRVSRILVWVVIIKLNRSKKRTIQTNQVSLYKV